jgi:uncharacterized protein
MISASGAGSSANHRATSPGLSWFYLYLNQLPFLPGFETGTGGGPPEGDLMSTSWHDPQVIHSLLTPDILNLIVMPTEQCNFRCAYCYEDFALGRISPQTVQGIKSLIQRRAPSLKLLAVSWFGGEPLLAEDVVLDLTTFAARIARQHKGLRFQSDMTTNGYLLSAALLGKLLSAGVTSYQISLDGPPQLHDRTRHRAGGQPTFARIWNNLQAMHASTLHFDVTIRIHLTRELGSHLPQLAAMLATLADDDRFKILPKVVSDLGGPGSDFPGSSRLTRAEADQMTAQLQTIIGQHLPGVPVRYETGGQQPCYAAHANSFVVRADGALAKCTVALTDPRNQIGRLDPSGDLIVESTKLQPWIRGLATHDMSELECPLEDLPASPTAEHSRPLLPISVIATR